MAITAAEYFAKPRPPEHERAAAELLSQVNGLINEAVEAGVFQRSVNPHTGCEISGALRGDGDGGYRTPGSRTGAPSSSHRSGQGVDVYDPGDRMDAWIDDSILARHGLFREHPDDTPGWCHLTTRSPRSGLRTFKP